MLFGIAFDNQLHLEPPRLFPKINMYISYLTREILSMLNRYQYKAVQPTPGIMTLVQVLTSLPLDKLAQEKDQYKRFLILEENSIENAGRMLDAAYDHESGMKPNFCGIANHPCPLQYILPTTCKDPLVDMPMGREWQAWKAMRPFRIGAVETNQISFHAYLDVLLYQQKAPTFCVYTLNIPMLALMYSVYLDSINHDVKDDTLIQFLHTYVVYPALLSDNVNLWLLGRYLFSLKQQLGINLHIPTGKFEDAIWEQANNGRIGSEYPLFMDEVQKLTSLLITRNIYPEVYLSSCLLENNVSVLSYFKNYQEMNEVPNLRQYNWIEYLRDSDWIEFFTLVLSYNKQWTQYGYFKSYLNRCLRLFQESHSWNECENEYIRNYIQYHIQTLLSIIDSKEIK